MILNDKTIKINEVQSETTRIYNPCGYRVAFSVKLFFYFFFL